MRNEISQKDVPWAEGASGDGGGDRQGESDRMIWAAARQGRASLLLEGVGSRDVSRPWALASSHRARQRSERSDALQAHVTTCVLVYSGIVFQGHLSFGYLGVPSSPLRFLSTSSLLLSSPSTFSSLPFSDAPHPSHGSHLGYAGTFWLSPLVD